MNQELIGKTIKEIRKKENLSQQKFAEKYGVTYQAVSKWENGKNIPDITIIKEICKDYNLDLNDFLDTKIKKKFNNKFKYIIIGIIILTIFTLILSFYITQRQSNNNFEFKTLSSNCTDFNLYGSIAYNDSKSSIYISHIIYCGKEDTTKYKEIECTLYESNDKTKTEISKVNYNQDNIITLEEYLKDITFNIDNYEKTCKTYKENSLYLEINAIDIEDKITTYKIPLTLEENCID